MSTATLTRLSESVFQEASLAERIDREKGVIRRVKVLGLESANGRTYPLKVIRECVNLYDGVKVNIDHPSKPGEERSYLSGWGELRNPVVESTGLWADIHYNREHEHTKRILEDCERFPTQFGLSHNAEGEVITEQGKQVVESVHSVESVDVVGQPATNKGIWESVTSPRKKGKPMLKTVEQIIADAPKGTPGLVGLLEQVEEGIIDPEAIIEVPAAVEGEAVEGEMDTAEGEMKAALKSVVATAIDDETLDMKGTLDVVKKVLKAHEDIIGPVGDGSGNPEALKKADEVIKKAEEGEGSENTGHEEEAAVEEEKEVSESLRKELSATKALADAGVPLTEAKIKALKHCTVREQRELAESWASTAAPGRPTTSGRKFGNLTAFEESIKGEGGFAAAVK